MKNFSKIFLYFSPLIVLFVLSGCSFEVPKTDDSNLASTLDNCWACSIYVTLFNAMGDLSGKILPNLCDFALNLLGVGLLFWIVFRSFKLLGSFQEPDLKKYWLEILPSLFKAMLVASLLWKYEVLKSFINHTITPLVTIIINLGKTLLYSSFDALGPDSSLSIQSLGGPHTPLSEETSQNYLFFSKTLSQEVEQIIYGIMSVLDFAWSLVGVLMESINPICWLLALVAAFLVFLVQLVIPLMFLDGFIRIGGTLLLSPFILVAWVFPETKSFLIKTWQVIFGSVLQLFITCIVVSLLTTMMNVLYSETSFFKNPNLLMDGTFFARLLGFDSGPFFVFIFLVFTYHTLLNIPKISGFFGGDSSESVMAKTILSGVKLAGNIALLAAGAALAFFTGGALGKGMITSAISNLKDQASQEASTLLNGETGTEKQNEENEKYTAGSSEEGG